MRKKLAAICFAISMLLASCNITPRQAPTGDVLEAQANRRIKCEVTVTAPVKRLLPDDTRGLPHQKFLIELSNGTSVLIAHDTKMAPHVPLKEGDLVTIHGEYIWNDRGGLIHWTHHTDTPRHEGGYIELAGQKYE